MDQENASNQHPLSVSAEHSLQAPSKHAAVTVVIIVAAAKGGVPIRVPTSIHILNRRQWTIKADSTLSLPGRSPTPVLTRPCAINFGGRKRSGAFDTVWPSAKMRLRNVGVNETASVLLSLSRSLLLLSLPLSSPSSYLTHKQENINGNASAQPAGDTSPRLLSYTTTKLPGNISC